MFEFQLPAYFRDIVLLLVRVVVCIAFLTEFSIKIRNVAKFAKNDGLPVVAAWVVTICELLAAVSILTGVMASFAAAGVIILMSITISMHLFKWHSSYRAAKGGWEYDALLLVLAAVVLVFGAGRIAL